VEYYGTPPIQMPSGLKGIGNIEEGNGCGFQAIGRTDKLKVKSDELKRLKFITDNSKLRF
jgi:hypothetical protein